MGGTIGKESCDEFDASCGDAQQPWYKDIEVDDNGCRKFRRLPPPGVHPRLFFTKEEIPQLRARMKHPKIWDKLYKVLDATMKIYKAYSVKVNALSPEERTCPTEATIREFFKADEARNTGLLGALCWGFINDDAAVIDGVKGLVVFYSRVIRASRVFALTNEATEKPFDFWHTKKWDVGSPWIALGSSGAICYDLLYNTMNESEREDVRGAIADVCCGRISWGVGWPARRIQSNWAPYNSQLYVMQCAIEDEEGFEEETLAKFENLLMQYLDFAFHDSGHPMEDAYALNLGFREGSYSLLAMARRGLNLFNHPKYKKCFTEWLPFAMEPGPGNAIYGGSSGSAMMYPTSMIMAKFVFPHDDIIDYVYRKYISENNNLYGRLTKYQSRLPVMLFAMPSLNDERCLDEHGRSLNLPLSFSCTERGKMVLRSDWGLKALWLTLDARPDAFFIGHDSPSRGQFVLHGLGRAWSICPEWNSFQRGEHYSIPTINGTSQVAKAPSVHPLGIRDDSVAAADLTYAYNWSWTQWAKEGKPPSAEWEEDPSDPRDFGMRTWWLPSKLVGERRVAFQGLHQYRKRIGNVEKVTRTALMVRAENPYAIIADRLRINGQDEHSLGWNMVLKSDISLESSNTTDAILAEAEGDRRMLIRSLGNEGGFKVVNIHGADRNGNETIHPKLIFETNGVKIDFRILLYPLEDANVALPSTEWSYNEDGGSVVVTAANGGDGETITFASGIQGEITMTLE